VRKASSRCSSANGTVSVQTRDVLMADLQYADCTWEKYDEIKDGAQAAIEEFHTRQQRTTVPARSIPYAIHARPAYTKINEDPEYLLGNGGALKPFQLTGLNWLAYVWSKGENGILADEVGLPSCSLLTEDGTWQNGPVGIFPLVPLPHATTIRPLPRCRPAVYDFRLANAVQRLGPGSQRDLLHGLGSVARGYPTMRIRTGEEPQVQRLAHHVRIHPQRSTRPWSD